MEKLLKEEIRNEKIDRALNNEVQDEEQLLNDENWFKFPHREQILQNQKENRLREHSEGTGKEYEKTLRSLNLPQFLHSFENPRAKEETEGRYQNKDRSDNFRDNDGAITGIPSKVDPSSQLANDLEAMQIADNGKVHLVQGLHPEDSMKAKGESLDKHFYTQEVLNDLYKVGGHRRNFVKRATLWEKGIVPYVMHNMSSYSVRIIERAIRQMNTQTCVKWIEKNQVTEPLSHDYAVYFIAESGCWSWVGRVHPIQYLSLSEPWCVTVSTTIHEMLHAMGSHHEQSRSDRDNYVTMHWDNIRGGTGNNNMAKANTFDNNPYDAESAMQYSLYSFSTNGRKTISFKDQRLEFLADSANGLEFYDIADVTKVYNCTGHCTSVPNCQNGGFVNFQCVCLCPDSLTGPLCETPVSTGNCGGVINIVGDETKYIESPNFSAGGNYPTGLDCTWLIKGSPGGLVRASVEYMDIASSSVCNHWLEYPYNLLGQRGPKKCGTNFVADSEVWDSTMDELPNEMIIKFNSEDTNVQPKRGFRIKLKNMGTGCVSHTCVFGKCESAPSGNNYKCICDKGVTGVNCDTFDENAVLTYGFEFGEKGFLVDVKNNDDFDWSIISGSTPSSLTGPDKAKEGYQYAFIEASSPRVQGNRALLETNLKLKENKRCLTFWYHMYGSSMGTMNVYTEGTGVAKAVQWTRTGNQGSTWLEASIDIPRMPDLKITIEAICGDSYQSDIAIDDVKLRPGLCSNQATTPQPTNPQTTFQPTTYQSTTYQPSTNQSTTYQPSTRTPTTYRPTTHQPTSQRPTTTWSSTPQPTTYQPTTAWPTTTTSPGPVTGKQTCTFEPNTPCFLVEDQKDDRDWTLISGSTPSAGTGPSRAYEGSYYMYMEMSSPTRMGDIARLVSAATLTDSNYCLRFVYHMYGSDLMGTLKVSTGTATPSKEFFAVKGNKGDQWIQASVDLKGVAGQKLFISAERCVTWKGDIAIDDIKLVHGPCGGAVGDPCLSNPCQNSGQCKVSGNGYVCHCTSGFSGGNCEAIDDSNVAEFKCTFEGQENCVFQNQDKIDKFDWISNQGKTPSRGTGPSSAYEGITYMYIEVSSPRVAGDIAILSTASFGLQANSDYCLMFFYHMQKRPGTLRVTVTNRLTPHQQLEVFVRSGDQGDKWQMATVAIPSNFSDPVISIEGIRGTSWQGDIAIDDILLSKGRCGSSLAACNSGPCKNGGSCVATGTSYSCLCPTGYTGINCDKVGFSCTFEYGSTCVFENVTGSDEFDWTPRQGKTPSVGTGPSKAYQGSVYIYIETSYRFYRDTAKLSTKNTALVSGSNYCLSFMYHMKVGSGYIDVYAGDTTATDYIWGKAGKQKDEDNWKSAVIDIPAYSDPVIEIIGTRGYTFDGDIAIDDLSLYQGACPTK